MHMDTVKRFRGIVKQFFPYCIEAAYVREKYGIADSFDDLRPKRMIDRLQALVANILPYGLVRWWRQRRAQSLSADLPTMAEELGLFDRDWYVRNNPDVDFAQIDPRQHFFSEGWKEYRDPSECFSVSGYMARYLDVTIRGVNPLEHFMLKGRWEGRDTCAPGPFLGGAPSWRDRLAAFRRKEPPFFSIVVASYNYEDLVLETLESLMAQTYRRFEVIVVDDGSTDKSRENIRRFISEHSGGDVAITLHVHPNEENRGLAETVRLGVEKSRGEFVAFCESDDVWMPDHLAALSDFIGRYGAAEVIANDVDIFGDPVRVAKFNGIKALRYKKLRHVRNCITPAQFRERNYLLTFSVTAVRRDAFRICDWHPVARPAALDWWLWRQICFDRPIYFLNKPLTRWRMHDSYMFKAYSAADKERTFANLHKRFTLACDALLKRQHPFSLQVRFLAPSAQPEGNAYHVSSARRKKMREEREKGLEESKDMIVRNARARILVCLHLFYSDAWDVIAEYLENLRPYHFDLVITCVQELIGEETLDKIRTFMPGVQIVFTPNKGFDIGPFVEVLRTVDLDRYDIVYKLQSKGVRRPRIYIYNQMFKYGDWFYNLFNGVLGGTIVHKGIDALMNDGMKLVAANNLIVQDPIHKSFFMKRFCEMRGLEFQEDYSFVAGSCFAIRAEALKPLKKLGFGIDDFEIARPGEFSLAHAIERWVCFAVQGAMLGIEVSHPRYRNECAAMAAKSAIRLLSDDRFKIDYDFFYRVLEMRPVSNYEIVEVRLGDLMRYWYDGRLYPLEQCPPYKYLCGDRSAYDEYCRQNEAVTGFAMTPERFDALCASMEEYDPKFMPVVLGPRNIIQDGQHRSCILLRKYGPDHKIEVLRIQ